MPSTRSFVAHIDILGYRSMVSRDPAAAWGVLSQLAGVRQYLSRLTLTRIEQATVELLSGRVYSVMFSDTIMLFTKGEEEADLQAILIASSEVLHKAMFNAVPVRIGLAGGQFFFNPSESMYSGPALIDAYDLGESAQWLGIVTTEQIWKQSVAAGWKSDDDDVVVPAEIPTTAGSTAGYAVNWPTAYRHDFKVPPPISPELFYSQFEHAFGSFDQLPQKQRTKYENTTTFINASLTRA